MKRWTAAAATALILSGLGASGAAHAQQGDSSAPIDVSADQQETINSKCITIFRGNVEILQNRSRMRAKQVTIYSARKAGGDANNNCGAAQRMEAEGTVYLVSEAQQARGDHAVYTFDNNIAVLTGNVVVTKGKDVTTGDKLTVNTKTNDAKLESNNPGRTASKRVRAVFYQEDNKTSDTPVAADQTAPR